MAKQPKWRIQLGTFAEICSIASFAYIVVQFIWNHWSDMPISSKGAMIAGVIFAAVALIVRARDRAILATEFQKRKHGPNKLQPAEMPENRQITQKDVIMISLIVAVGFFYLMYAAVWLNSWYEGWQYRHPQAPWYEWYEFWKRF